MLSIPEYLIIDGAVDLSAPGFSGDLISEQKNNLGINYWAGSYKVLVVRVTDQDGLSPTPSAAELSIAVFSETGTTIVSAYDKIIDRNIFTSTPNI